MTKISWLRGLIINQLSQIVILLFWMLNGSTNWGLNRRAFCPLHLLVFCNFSKGFVASKWMCIIRTSKLPKPVYPDRLLDKIKKFFLTNENSWDQYWQLEFIQEIYIFLKRPRFRFSWLLINRDNLSRCI